MEETKEQRDESKAIGGHARAQALAPERRKAIAAKAANARWRGKPVKATHAGVLKLGAKELACANLPDGTRVISEATMMAALGRVYSGYYSKRDAAADPGSAVVPRYLAPAGLKPYISADLADLLQPIAYITPTGGNIAKGVRAEALPQICDVWLKARAAGALGAKQQKTAIEAEIIVRGLAHVGIIALIDEATGFQDDRAHDALVRILERFIAKELRPYVKTFPHDFYKEIYRLRGWNYPPENNHHNSNLGKLTNDLVYDRLAPGSARGAKQVNSSYAKRPAQAQTLSASHVRFWAPETARTPGSGRNGDEAIGRLVGFHGQGEQASAEVSSVGRSSRPEGAAAFRCGTSRRSFANELIYLVPYIGSRLPV